MLHACDPLDGSWFRCAAAYLPPARSLWTSSAAICSQLLTPLKTTSLRTPMKSTESPLCVGFDCFFEVYLGLSELVLGLFFLQFYFPSFYGLFCFINCPISPPPPQAAHTRLKATLKKGHRNHGIIGDELAAINVGGGGKTKVILIEIYHILNNLKTQKKKEGYLSASNLLPSPVTSYSPPRPATSASLTVMTTTNLTNWL